MKPHYIVYRRLHTPCNTEKSELTYIFVSGYIHAVLKLLTFMEVNSVSVARK